MSLDLSNPEYIAICNESWSVSPDSMSVIEYSCIGDTFFDGDIDDRPLGKDGGILSPGYHSSSVVRFKTVEEAHQAALKINNRRPNTTLGVAPTWPN